MKTLVIGDIHGCYDELQDLLDAGGLGDDDQIVAIGDLVNRGPFADRVLRFFQKNGHQSVMGNHEYKHIRAYRGEMEPTLSQLLTRWQLKSHYVESIHYMRSLPASIELPEALLVHAYFEPNLSLEDQEDRILLGTGGATRYLQERFINPWYTYYKGDKPLIVGHKDYSLVQEPFAYKDRVFGIDTGCVYGGKLTGLLLPDFEFISAAARRNYWQDYLDQYSQNE